MARVMSKMYWILSIELDKGDFETRFNLAVTYFHSGKYDKALEVFDELVKEGRGDQDLFFTTGGCNLLPQPPQL